MCIRDRDRTGVGAQGNKAFIIVAVNRNTSSWSNLNSTNSPAGTGIGQLSQPMQIWAIQSGWTDATGELISTSQVNVLDGADGRSGNATYQLKAGTILRVFRASNTVENPSTNAAAPRVAVIFVPRADNEIVTVKATTGAPTRRAGTNTTNPNATFVYNSVDDALYYWTGSAYAEVDIGGAGTTQLPSDWDAISGVTRILNKPTIPAAQVNSDWDATSGLAQILNKPTLPAGQVNSDWDATSGLAQITHCLLYTSPSPRD